MTNKAFDPARVSELIVFGDTILATDMVFDERIVHGIVLLNDDMKSAGIRPRWCTVYKIGPDQKDVKIGDKILVEHGRWSRGIKIRDDEGVKTIRKIDPNGIMGTSDQPINDNTMSDKV